MAAITQTALPSIAYSYRWIFDMRTIEQEMMKIMDMIDTPIASSEKSKVADKVPMTIEDRRSRAFAAARRSDRPKAAVTLAVKA